MGPARDVKGKRGVAGETNGRPAEGLDDMKSKARRGKEVPAQDNGVLGEPSPSQPSKRPRTSTKQADPECEEESGSEAEALKALRLVTTTVADMFGKRAASREPGAIDSVVDWRRGLEELWKSRPAADAPITKRTQDDILNLFRAALQKGEWRPVLLGAVPKSLDMAFVVKGLEIAEVVQAFQTFAHTFDKEPRKQSLCSAWILQLVEHHGDALASQADSAATLRQLLESLEKRLGHVASTEASACAGKWKLVAELGAVRRASVKEPVDEDGGSAPASRARPVEAEESSDEEDALGEDAVEA